jgi:hypothetical protein
MGITWVDVIVLLWHYTFAGGCLILFYVHLGVGLDENYGKIRFCCQAAAIRRLVVVLHGTFIWHIWLSHSSRENTIPFDIQYMIALAIQ